MASGPLVVKIGGSTLGSHDTSLEDLVAIQQLGTNVVVVHGGGSVISKWMERQGAAPRFIRGLRVTDAQSLEIVIAVLTGLVNKQLVATLTALGARAVGMSGVDGGMLEARISEPEMGYVGVVTGIDPTLIYQALEGHYIPVVAPIGFSNNGDSSPSANMLNINGDTAAGELAWYLGAERLVFLTDVSGVMDGAGRVIPRLPSNLARRLLDTGVAKGGMIPKLQACIRALEKIPAAHIIDGRRPGALLQCLKGKADGTLVQA